MRVGHHRPGPRLATTERSQRRGGYVLVEFAFLLVPLLIMVGLSVDVGYWYNRASNLQKAADAAALAGVVWLPDVAKAETYAKQAAARNGFVDGTGGISVDVDPVGDRRLRVTIVDPAVSSFFYKVLGGRTIELGRSGTAEYVLPVPLGSPKNYFGTGRLLADPELLYQSINPACTSKVNGDRHQSLHYNPLSSNGSNLSSCSSTPSNPDYRSTGYDLYIEAPAGRSSNIDVLLYDPRYNINALSYQVQTGESCTIDYETSWRGPTSSSSNITITGPLRYQTRSSNTSSWWSSEQTLDSGDTYTFPADRLRYRYALFTYPGAYVGTTSSSTNVTAWGPIIYSTRANSTTTTWTTDQVRTPGQSITFAGNRLRWKVGQVQTTCVPTYETVTEDALDSDLRSGGFTGEDFTFTLRSENGTPLDTSDDYPVDGCTKVYSTDTPFELEYLGSKRWNKLCSITPQMASGKYVLRVTNGAPGNINADGSNQWGLVAKYENAAGQGLCDGRTDTTCPRVYGRDAISVYANTSAASASFFLAEIPEYHTGKTLELELWDPGEGGSHIEILQPKASAVAGGEWALKTFSWVAYNEAGTQVSSGSNVTQVSVASSVFNGRLLRIRIQLDGYDPPANNMWWKIRYTFGSGSVTDRTTWSAKVIGDPVHLVEDGT